jgi:hypothetical protein
MIWTRFLSVSFIIPMGEASWILPIDVDEKNDKL